MSTNDEILQVATHELLARVDAIAETGNENQRLAAGIAWHALLALRDTVKRPEYPDIYRHRIISIQELCSSLPPPPK